MKEKWDRALVQADQASRALGKGNAPAELQRLLDALKAPAKLNWKDETADFLKSSIATRNDWTRSARRHALAATIIPSRKVDSTGLVVFVRDTSGSIDDKLTAEFTALISQCCADLNCEALVMDCDTIIHAEYRLAPGEDAPLHAKGGGGTDFREPFARVAELVESGENVAGLVYLTDLCGDEPESVDVATLWLSTTDTVAQTGRTVHVEL
jgi:predicted metal-dependent peptidase